MTNQKICKYMIFCLLIQKTIQTNHDWNNIGHSCKSAFCLTHSRMDRLPCWSILVACSGTGSPGCLWSRNFCACRNSLNGACRYGPTRGTCLSMATKCSTWCSEKIRTTKNIWNEKLKFSCKSTWTCILTNALPIRVAPKKVQNGIRKWPQVMPAKSNSGLGMEANSRMPGKPTRMTTCSIQRSIDNFHRLNRPWEVQNLRVTNWWVKANNLLGHLALHKVQKLLVVLILGLFAWQSCCARHEIRRQFAQCRPRSPHQRLKSDLYGYRMDNGCPLN